MAAKVAHQTPDVSSRLKAARQLRAEPDGQSGCSERLGLGREPSLLRSGPQWRLCPGSEKLLPFCNRPQHGHVRSYGVDSNMMENDRSKLLIIARLSVAVSIALAALPFFVPAFPIGPVLLLNWALFMSVGYFVLPKPIALFRLPRKRLEKNNEKTWLIVFFAFTVAGYVALFNAEAMFQAGDLAELR